MSLSRALAAATLTCLTMLGAVASLADTVKVTPLGTHEGEFCRFDGAMIFEDPGGTRILFDAGRTVAGPTDPRLGKIDIILVSHMHARHLGDKHIEKTNDGPCDKPNMPVSAVPNSNTVNIALATGATIVTGSEMPRFFTKKLLSLGASPTQSRAVRFGASRTIGGVKITTVPATHSNGVSPDFIDGPLGDMLRQAGLTAYAGPATGYVLTFSNGLVAYLSGDTGVTSEQKTVVADQYGAKLVVLNIGDTFTAGPEEAAYVVNELIKPTSVILSHANEVATSRGVVLEGTRTERFMAIAQADVFVPLSGQTRSFNGDGTCVDGC